VRNFISKRLLKKFARKGFSDPEESEKRALLSLASGGHVRGRYFSR
jgi:hypothetical protein